jgi:DNA processing protein
VVEHRDAFAVRELSPADKLAWLMLARCDGIGPMRFARLLRRLGSARAALEALPRMIEAGTAPDVRLCRREEALRELDAIAAQGATLIAACEPLYPAILREIADAPPLLTLFGDARQLTGPAVAMVGARNASGNGRLLARAMAAEIAREMTVVSGLARGIDTACHLGALDSGGCTIAVIASGIDVPYPAENAGLARRIADGGCVVSERPLGAAPQARHFPRRNRIISGLSLGVVVIEAAPSSGSLITARLAAEQGREVMSVPGTPLDPRHRGTNQLLRDGAALVENAADVLTTLRSAPARPSAAAPVARPVPPAREVPPATGGVRRLAELLGPEPMPLDELVRQCGLSVAEVQEALLDLELSGRLDRHPGNRVALRLD